MKHIQKKFLFEYELENKQMKDFDIEQQFDISTLKDNSQSILKPNKNRPILLETEFNKLLLGYAHVEQGKACVIPLPDFTLVYYDNAYNLNIQRKEIRKKIFKEINEFEKVTETASKYFYDFYGISTSCLINMFTCLESFTNSCLNSNVVYTKNNQNYNYQQIQKNISFDSKVKFILPEIFRKEFKNYDKKSYDKIFELEMVRDSIIHTKSDEEGLVHIDLFKRLLSFEYEITLNSMRSFMNFYKPNYIVDCPCNETF